METAQEAISISRAESVLGQTEEICHEEEAADKTDPGQDEPAHFSHADTVDKKSRHNKCRLARNRADEENPG